MLHKVLEPVKNDVDVKWCLLRRSDVTATPPKKVNGNRTDGECGLRSVLRREASELMRISARDCSVILGLSPFIKRQELLHSKAGMSTNRVELTVDMKRGIELEPVALNAFQEYIGFQVHSSKCKEIRFPNFLLSGRADGIVNISGHDRIIEVKCPKRNSRKCPVAHYIQIQIYIYLYGCTCGYYVEFIKNRPLNVIKIHANTQFMSALWCHLSAFADDVVKLKNSTDIL